MDFGLCFGDNELPRVIKYMRMVLVRMKKGTIKIVGMKKQ